MEVILWDWTSSWNAARAAATCTNAENELKALAMAVKSGHESVLEHVVCNFRISGISRVTLAQLTRHRLASYSVQSQRYVKQSEAYTVVPPSVEGDKATLDYFNEAAAHAHEIYEKLIALGVPKEDARYILPEGTETKLFLTMNARELRHFFSLRCCNKAQWEIRELANKMLGEVMSKVALADIIFSDAGPGCVRGKCPEAKPCGHPVAKEGNDG